MPKNPSESQDPKDHTDYRRSSRIFGSQFAPESMRRIDQEITRMAGTDRSVLLTGESGTGKTTVANIIHERSRRAEARIVDINCAALPDNLLESELFGFEKGAFTGAMQRKSGLFEVADKGTLFLDEIGELKLELQAKLLKVIDGRKIRRLGGLAEVECDVRFIAASSRDLPKMIGVGKFREDLYYRLAVLQLDLPPLRKREDIQELLLKQFAVEQETLERHEPFHVDEAALKELCRYDWPGNIRHLQNVVARLACYAEGDLISVADVRAELARFEYLDSETIALPDSCSVLFADESLDEFSRRVRGAAIEAVKCRNKGNMSQVARRLKFDRSSLWKIAQRTNGSCQSRLHDCRRVGGRSIRGLSPAQ
jgi:transcriptional regulator with PAS, ATPase and Fis domain